MDFAEFAEQYRRRTEKRMLDFEAMLRDNQRKMAQTAKYHAMAQANPDKPPLVVPRGEYSYPATELEVAAAAGRRQEADPCSAA